MISQFDTLGTNCNLSRALKQKKENLSVFLFNGIKAHGDVKSLPLCICKDVGLHNGTTLNELNKGLLSYRYRKAPFIDAAAEMSRCDELLSIPFQEAIANWDLVTMQWHLFINTPLSYGKSNYTSVFWVLASTSRQMVSSGASGGVQILSDYTNRTKGSNRDFL